MSEPSVPPGWFPDPWKEHAFRYWDGATWTGHVSDGAGFTQNAAPGAVPPASWQGGPPNPPAAPAYQPLTSLPPGAPVQPTGPQAAWQSQPQGQAPGPGPAWQGPYATTTLPLPPRRRRSPLPWILSGVGLVVIAVIVALVFHPFGSPVSQGPVSPPASGTARSPRATQTWVASATVPAPVSVGATAVDGRTIGLTWQPATGGPAINSYAILRDGAEIGTVSGATTAYTDSTGLTPANTYSYAVVAVAGSDRSAPSVEAQAAPLAPAPTKLTATRTVTSITLSWKAPGGAPVPDQYKVTGGAVEAVIPGSQTQFGDTRLTPNTSYQYTVTALWGQRPSDTPATLTVRTLTPSLSSARLTGSWTVKHKMTKSSGTWPKVGRTWETYWDFTPSCATGACKTAVSSQIQSGDTSVKVTLARSGTSYTGSKRVQYSRCRTRRLTDTVTVRLKVTKAAMMEDQWVATAFTGTLSVRSPYASVGGGWYCPVQTHAMTISGKVG